MKISNWMSWEGGIDLVAATAPDLDAPNVIVHLARIVHTPIGSAPSGLILIPDALNPTTAPPQMMGFVSQDESVGAYFGPHIFAGTPFENAPVLGAHIEIHIENDSATATLRIGETLIETHLSGLGEAYDVNRPAEMLPFLQQGVERRAARATLKVNGEEIPLFVPEIGMTGGPGAVLAACGVYLR